MSTAELTTIIPADPRVPSLPQGQLTASLRDGRIWIEQADPRVVMGVQLLELIRISPNEHVTLTLADGQDALGCRYEGAVLRIEAANRTIVYRVTECLPWYLGYIAEWPD